MKQCVNPFARFSGLTFVPHSNPRTTLICFGSAAKAASSRAMSADGRCLEREQHDVPQHRSVRALSRADERALGGFVRDDLLDLRPIDRMESNFVQQDRLHVIGVGQLSNENAFCGTAAARSLS